MRMERLDGSCVAWWHLNTQLGNSCYVAVFVENECRRLSVDLAVGATIDQHIVKPDWSWYRGDPCAKPLGRALKYARAIVSARQRNNFLLTHRSFSSNTGTNHDDVMHAWSLFNILTLSAVSSPAWWPRDVLERAKRPPRKEVDAVALAFNYSVDSLTSLAREASPNLKKPMPYVRTYRRVGRFTVFQKDPTND